MTVAGDSGQDVEPKRAAVVYNPLKIDAARLKSLVSARAVAHGWGETLWYETTQDDAGQLLTAEAISAGVDVVMAAGGDGTVRAVAEALRGSGIPLALLAIGTGNLLARNLNVTLNTEDAIELMFMGYDRPIDLGIISIERTDASRSTHVFLVITGLGIDAKMIAKTNPGLKKAFGWLAYIDGTVRALPELRAVKLKVSIDGEGWRNVSAHSVMAGNCGLLPGGILLIPDAKPDDGKLDFIAIRPKGAFGWVRVWNKVTIENGVLRRTKAGRKLIDISPDVDDVIYRQGRDLRLKLEKPQEIQLDGDEFGVATGIHVSIDPKALHVRV